ncbi:MAG TPA: S41 family peptidase [Pirellulales bacterium]|jgi:carboxyl-terminal processing protease|nr:S41 family peptidase [Pirellulales bacterium]
MLQPFVLAFLRSSHFTAALADSALKGLVLLAAAAALALACRRGSAAMRHIVWSTATTGLLLLPLAAAFLPHWNVSLPASWLARPPAIHDRDLAQAKPAVGPIDGTLDAMPLAADTVSSPAESVFGMGAQREQAEPTQSAVHPASIGGMEWLVLVWSLGAVAAMVPTVAGWVSLILLRGKSRPLADGPVAATLAELAARLAIRRRITVWESHARQVPMTWGVWRPVIVLPAESASWPRERLRAVLLHELAHVSRCDCLTQWLAQWARALHWFNPLAWYAVAALRFEQEQACDDQVLNSGHGAADYAEQLLAVTSGRVSPRWSASVALAMGRPQRLERRLRTILDPSRNRRGPSHRQTVLAMVCGVAMLAPLAAVNVELAGNEPRAKAQAQGDDGKTKSGDEPATEANPEAELERLRDARAKVLENYFKKLDTGKMTEGAIQGMLAALDDPYSEYFSPRQLAEFNKQSGGKLVGIGAMLAFESDDADATKNDATPRKVMVVTPLEGSPALKAGLEADDEILEVDGKSIAGLELSQIIVRVVGDEGTVVKLKVRRAGGGEVDLAITRGQVSLPAIEGLRRGADGRWDDWLDREHRIAYLRLLQFLPTTAVALRGTLDDLAKQGMQALVLDLRQCPGGMLAVAVEVANLFVADGVIVAVKSRDQETQETKADGKAPFAETPIMVLIDEQTASAAEVLAGALRERKATLLVGVRTFGKGSVQSIVQLVDNQGALKLTTGFFQSPGGHDIDRAAGGDTWGVDPSEGCHVPLDEDQATAMARLRRERSVLRKSAAAPLADLTPESIGKQMADLQLAAGLKAALAKLATGEFVAVGEPLPALLQDGRREQLDEQRRAIMAELRRLERELKLIDKAYDPRTDGRKMTLPPGIKSPENRRIKSPEK